MDLKRTEDWIKSSLMWSAGRGFGEASSYQSRPSLVSILHFYITISLNHSQMAAGLDPAMADKLQKLILRPIV